MLRSPVSRLRQSDRLPESPPDHGQRLCGIGGQPERGIAHDDAWRIG